MWTLNNALILMDLPPLTPPSDIIAIVLKLVKDSDKRLSRKEVYNPLSQSSQIRTDDRQALSIHIGFGMSILERKEKISRTGKGKIGNPNLYSSR